MEKPIFELQGLYESANAETVYVDCFETLDAAEAFAEANLDEYTIHMRMKIAEKRHGKI